MSTPRHCPKGHDTQVGGREASGSCRRCRRIRVREQARERQQWVAIYKLLLGCARCGWAEHSTGLTFHHRDLASKTFEISSALLCNWDRVLNEILKCDVLCRNCHAVLHTEGTDVTF